MNFSEIYNKTINLIKVRIRLFFHFFEGRQSGKTIFLISLIVPTIIIFFLSVILPLFVYPNVQIEDDSIIIENNFIPLFKNSQDSLEYNQWLIKQINLKTEEMFLKSQLKMAKSGSIGLSIDLVDSMVALQIRGVKVRECKIQRFKTSNAFKHLKAKELIIPWLSSLFTLQKEWSTIQKVPIKIRKAPKDTLEANKFKNNITNNENFDVYISMQFDRNLLVEIIQIESPSFAGRIHKWYHNIKSNLITFGNTLFCLLTFTQPAELLWIELNISQNDAKAIYRALPRNATMALRILL